MRLHGSSLVVVCSALTALASAQPSIYRSETRMVVLYATVKTAKGEMVTNLDANAFRIYENGKLQSIALFRNDDVPLSMGLLIDNSGSMRSKRSTVEAAALALVRASNPQDEIFVLNFADKPVVDVPFTSNVTQLEASIARVDSIGGTAMRDAVDAAERYVDEQATRDRKALLIITDGSDNASVVKLDAIRRHAERSMVVIYAVGLLADENSADTKNARHQLDELAEATGGTAFYPERLDDIVPLATTLAREIRSQYMIAYEPLDRARDGAYRKIRVDVRTKEALTVRTRDGYRAD